LNKENLRSTGVRELKDRIPRKIEKIARDSCLQARANKSSSRSLVAAVAANTLMRSPDPKFFQFVRNKTASPIAGKIVISPAVGLQRAALPFGGWKIFQKHISMCTSKTKQRSFPSWMMG